jgi:hypothetical protein
MKIKKGNKLLVGILSLSAFSMVLSGGLMKVDAAKSDDNDHNKKHLDSQENDHDGKDKDHDDKDEIDNEDDDKGDKDNDDDDKGDKDKNKSHNPVKKVTAKPVATSPSIVKKTTTIAPKKVTITQPAVKTQPAVITQPTTTTRPT